MGEARARAKAGRTQPQENAAPAPLLWRTLADRLFAIDLRALAVLRILLAVMVLCDLWERAPDIRAFYSDNGIFPRTALHLRSPIALGPHLSVHMLTGSAGLEAVWMVLAALWAVALLIGYRTTLSTAVTWYLLMSLQWRNTLILNSADDLMRFLLFWCLFLPLGARFSLDAKTGHGPNLPPEAERTNRFLSVGTAALLLQVGFMYWFAVAAKTDPSWRVTGMAVYYALSIDLYATPFGQFLLNFPQILYYATFGTLWLEGLGPTLAFSPFGTTFFRTVVPIAFFFFHVLFLNLCLDLGAFHYVSAVAWIPFLPTPVWDRIFSRLPLAKPARSNGTLAPAAPALPKARRWSAVLVNVVAGFFLVYVFLWNLRNIGEQPGLIAQRSAAPLRLLPHSLDRIGEAFHLDQGWAMFAPKPFTENGWYVQPATLKDGTTFDMLRGEGSTVSFDKPDFMISRQFKNERWRRYLMNLWGWQYVDQRTNYGRYLCREWNRTHSGGAQLSHVQLYYMLQMTLDNYEQAPVNKILLLDWRCGEGAGVGAPTKAAGKLDTSGRANTADTTTTNHATH